MNTFHFLRPDVLYLFIPCLILVFMLMRTKRHTDIWNKICSKDLMPYILARQGKRTIFPYLLLLSTLFLLIAALAGPTWQMNVQPVVKSQSGLVVALDLSPLMDAEDIKPSRLQRALYKINDLLNLRKEGQTALIVFSEEPFVVTPLTDDAATITALLPVLETKIMPASGHQVDKAMTKAAELLEQAGITNGSILLVTPEISKQDMEKTIEIATTKGVSISVLGVGTEEGTPIASKEGGFIKDDKGGLIITMLSKENLKQLARSTNGSYATISVDDSDIHGLVNTFSHVNGPQEHTELTHNLWHDQGYWLVLAALPLVSLIFRRGMLSIVLFFMPCALQAYSWDDLWKTSDQQAEQLFHNEEYQQARELFQTSDWKAAASYKLGEYENAAELYQGNQSADGYYNYGTAKAKQGDFEEALMAYDKTLEMQPDHEDALHNKKIIEEMQKQEQQKNDSKKDQNKDQQKNQDQNQDKDQESNQDQNEDKGQENDQENNQSEKQEKSQSEEQDKQPEQTDPPKDDDKKENEKLQEDYREQVEEELKEKPQEEQEKQEAQEEEAPSQEDQQRQIDDRWLQRIKDDPGGLLRRKFLQQYQQQKQSKQLNGGNR